MRSRLNSFLTLALAALAFFPTVTARAGTPLICFPFEIGAAKSLPAGSDWPGVTQAYDRKTLVADTIALLTPDMPVIVRMETLRRAAVYSNPSRFNNAPRADKAADRAVADALLAALRERAEKATGPARSLALFDYGYFSESLRHTGMDQPIDGYTLIVRAAEIRHGDPAMEFALALAGSWPKRPEQPEHLARARHGAQADSLLAANIASHFDRS